MATEPRHAAVLRWGDTIYTLALVLTAHPERAARATVAAFQQAFTRDTDDRELALLMALVQQARPRRAPRRRRARSIDLDHLPPLDRLLLALWLVRAQSGPRLAAVFGVPADEIVARLDAALGPDTTTVADDHLDRQTWLRLRLDLAADTDRAAHLRACATCRTHAAAWQAAAEHVAERLRTATAGAHLPPAVATALTETDAAPISQPHRTRTTWLVVAAIALLITAMVVPWRRPPALPALPTSPQALVDAALARWDTAPSSGVIQTVVHAVPLWPSDAEAVTVTLWQAADGRHRYEAQRGEDLVEWQLGDGTQTLRYAADPRYASCRWATGTVTTAARFSALGRTMDAAAAQQRQALAARLEEGAYGTGYVLLQRARTAPDVRLLGSRAAASGAAAVVQFTDQVAEPPQSIVLTIDAHDGLQFAQAVTDANGQTRTRDLWRRVTQAPVTDVPGAVPASLGQVQVATLLDPACPALEERVALSPRALSTVPWTLAIPTAIPDDASAAWFAAGDLTTPVRGVSQEATLSLLISRPGSRLTFTLVSPSVSIAPPPSRPQGATMIDGVGGQLLLLPTANGSASGWFAPNGSGSGTVPWYRVWSVGWTPDELAHIIAAFAPHDAYATTTPPARVWDPQPLPEPVQTTLTAALTALRPVPDATMERILTVTTRTLPHAPGLADPYHRAAGSVVPPQVQVRQVLVAAAAGTRAVQQDATRPDGTIVSLQAVDATANLLYDASSHLLWRGPGETELIGAWARPITLDLVTPVLQPGTVRVTTDGRSDIVEQRWPFQADQMVVPPAWRLPPPATDGLRSGEVVARLTLDRTTHQIAAFALDHHATDGTVTLLSRVAVTQRRLETAPRTVASVAGMAMPEDVLTVAFSADQPPRVTGVARDWVARTYQWDSADATVVQDFPPRAQGKAIELGELYSGRWDAMRPGAAWRMTTYQIDAGAAGVVDLTLSQAPASVFGYMLRQTTPWRRSEVVSLTVGGQEREAWLLADGNRVALVVAVDDLLLHVTAQTGAPSNEPNSPRRAETVLRTTVVPALARLIQGSSAAMR